MFIYILLLTAVLVVSGAPHHDGSESQQTHSPIIAPDSESIIISEGHKFFETHHSDVYLSKSKVTNQTDLSDIPPGPSAIDSAEIHHGDAYMMKNKKTTEHETAESTTHNVQETTTLVPRTTSKAKEKNENSGSHPVAPVHHPSSRKKGGEGITKSIVAHSPLASYVENSKFEKTEKQQSSSSDNSGSIVAHGPMIKSGDNHERKHDNDGSLTKEGTVHSTIQHAPMATDHHPPKAVAHHPSLSKNVPVSSRHTPLLNHPVVEDRTKTDEESQIPETTEKDEVAEHHLLVHAPTATDPHPPKATHAHHPTLSETDASPEGVAHAPLAIPHDVKDTTSIHVEKRSEESSRDSAAPPKTIDIHHPLLSKTDSVAPSGSLKTNHDDARNDDQKSNDVTSTTEINGNSLETQHINPGHHLASSHPATVSPSS